MPPNDTSALHFGAHGLRPLGRRYRRRLDDDDDDDDDVGDDGDAHNG